MEEKSVEYLKKYAPIGARDYDTFKFLESNGIPSYFSGCLTLTLENSNKERENLIYAVDIDLKAFELIKLQAKSPVVFIKHTLDKPLGLTTPEKMAYAKELLDKYSRAKCVITSRLHAAMPCLALGTPVLLINTASDQYRFEGLKDLVRNCSNQEFLSGLVDFDLNNPGENPKDYIPIRESLIELVEDWVSKHSLGL